MTDQEMRVTQILRTVLFIAAESSEDFPLRAPPKLPDSFHFRRDCLPFDFMGASQ